MKSFISHVGKTTTSIVKDSEVNTQKRKSISDQMLALVILCDQKKSAWILDKDLIIKPESVDVL